MSEVKVTVGSRELLIWGSPVSGLEEIRLDGTVLSRKRTYRVISEHRFSIDEGDASGEYRVRMTGGMGFAVMRNGELVAEADRPLLRYFGAAGLCLFVAAAVELLAFVVAYAAAPERLDDLRQLFAKFSPLYFLLCFAVAIPVSSRLKKALRAFS
jgi:hypothetical protein